MWLPLPQPLLGTWPATQACALTGNQAPNLLVHRPALNPLSHTSWKTIYTALFTEHYLSVIKFVNFDNVGLYFEICIEKKFNVMNSHFSEMFVWGFFTVFIYSRNVDSLQENVQGFIFSGGII